MGFYTSICCKNLSYTYQGYDMILDIDVLGKYSIFTVAVFRLDFQKYGVSEGHDHADNPPLSICFSTIRIIHSCTGM